MKKVRYVSLLAVSATVLTFSACTKDAQIPDANNVSAATASPLLITANWEQGATSLLNTNAHAAGSYTLTVTKESSSQGNRVVFRDWNNGLIGRTNGAGDNGEATDAFSYKINAWEARVPFAYGTRNGKDAIWTPKYKTEGINGVYMAEFVEDNKSGDQDPAVGTIRVGNWRAVQLTIVSGPDSRKRVSIEELVNGNWVQRVRPNNNNGIVEMRAFTVLNVRTDYTISGGKVTAETVKSIPVLKSQLVGINNSNPPTNRPIILWTLQIGGQVSYNDELYRP